MMKNVTLYLLSIILFLAVITGGCKKPANETYQIAVTNTYLQCAVKDLYQNSDVLCLVSGGICPSHFDISPNHVEQLHKCKILFLFDFQKQFESVVSRLEEPRPKIVYIKTYKGLCTPATYLSICEEICQSLSSQYPDKKSDFEQRLAQIHQRLTALSSDISKKIETASLKNDKVIASYHQAEFANWLGLQTIATFSGSETETTATIDDCLKQAKTNNVKIIIANKQEGTILADTLAKQLNGKMVVFSNFPESRQNSFDELVLANVENLLMANK